MTELNTHAVKSAQRVLEVIEYFSRERPTAHVTDISRALGYPQSSTSVLLKFLRQLGYLYYERSTRTYRLTTRAALLGCWAEQGNYRGGRALAILDDVGRRTGHTAVLSVACPDYNVHHLHVIPGSARDAVSISEGDMAPMLGNVQGELQLATYPDENIRLALHRINAEAGDTGRRVNIPEKMEECHVMRERKWCIGPHAGAPGLSTVAAMLPRHKGGDRVVVSVVAPASVIEASETEFLRVLLEARDRHFASAPGHRARRIGQPASEHRTANGGAPSLASARPAAAFAASAAN